MNKPKYQHDLNRVKTTVHRLEASTGMAFVEISFLASFLVNFCVGKLIHFTSLPQEVYNYYNDKRNILNQVFVKQGWFWTTAVVAAYYGALVYNRSRAGASGARAGASAGVGPILTKALINYLVATAWWVLFTQWCFGLPLMDKIFVWTGGRCYVPPGRMDPGHKLALVFTQIHDGTFATNVINSKTCRQLKGQWEGGHDPSGHVFLLTHSSLYMFFEVRQYGKYGLGQVKELWAQLGREKTAGGRMAVVGSHILAHASILAYGLIGLWWFMLLMTNIYFHSILEKLVGLMFGYVMGAWYLGTRPSGARARAREE